MDCPQCHGQNVQRLAVIHAGGTTRIQTTHQAKDAIGRGAYIETTGYQQSALASTVAPPTGKSLLSPLILMVIGGIIMYDALKLRQSWGVDWSKFWLSLAILGVGVLMGVARWNYNVAQSRRHRVWARSWFCHSCGTVFEIHSDR